MKYIQTFFPALAVLIIIGCASQKKMFNDAKEENSINGYQIFLQKYPEGKFSAEAQDNLISLEYNKAKTINTIDAYGDFLKNYPNCKYSTDAKKNIINIEFEKVKKQNSIAAYEKFLNKYPNSEHTDFVENKIKLISNVISETERVIFVYNDHFQLYGEIVFSLLGESMLLWAPDNIVFFRDDVSIGGQGGEKGIAYYIDKSLKINSFDKVDFNKTNEEIASQYGVNTENVLTDYRLDLDDFYGDIKSGRKPIYPESDFVIRPTGKLTRKR